MNEMKIKFTNIAPEDESWSAHVHILNEWTTDDLKLRMIIAGVRGKHYPKHMHQDLIEQYFAQRKRKWYVTDKDRQPDNQIIVGGFSTAADAGVAREYIERTSQSDHTFWIEELDR